MQIEYPRLISSVYGEITAILLVYPGLLSAQGNDEYADIVKVFERKGVVYRFRKEVHQFKLAIGNFRDRDPDDSKNDRFRSQYNLEPGVDILSLLNSWSAELDNVRKRGTMTFQRWVQDPFLTLELGTITVLLNSLHNQRLCDFFLPLEVAQQVGPQFLVSPTRLYLEGGNLLRGIRTVFVGKDLIRRNRNELGLSRKEVMQQLRQDLGVDSILELGNKDLVGGLGLDTGQPEDSFQPIFHLDMFLNFAGLDESGKEIVLFGDPAMCIELGGLPSHPGVNPTEQVKKAIPIFKEVREQIEREGFRVIRLPLVFFNGIVFSWNNCLVEVGMNGKFVYLPSYQTSADHEQLNPTFRGLELYIENLYQHLGFEVIWFRHGRFFRTIAEHGGSLHCIVKVMRRKSAEPG